MMRFDRRSLMALAAGAVLLLAGCGGGGATGTGSSSAPSTRAKARVDYIGRFLFQGVQTFGRIDYPLPMAMAGPPTGGLGAAAGSADTTSTVPMLSAFLKNEALNVGQAQSRARKISRDVAPGIAVGEPMPPIWQPTPMFYKDYYLGLWVQTSYSDGESRYDLFEDEGKTKPAGSIVTVWPTQWDVFPQTYKSSYEFTAGYLKGSKGSSENVTEAGWSGHSKYDNLYLDGSKDQGASNWSGRGDSSSYTRTESADGKDWTETANSWYANGTGGTRITTSDGFEAIFSHNADGSGRGTIKGNEPGLPATVSWDNQGNVTIKYADGSVDKFNRWERWYGNGYGGGPIPVDVAVTPGGTTAKL